MKKNDIKKGVDDLYTRYAHTLEMLEKAVDKIDQLQEELDKKPKEVIVEKVVEKEIEIEIIKEIPIEKVVEKIVEVVKEVEVPKETVVTIEKEVPGPERIVEVPGPERRVEVPGPERIVEVPRDRIVELPVIKEDTAKIEKLEKQIQKLKNHVLMLEKDLNTKSDEVEIEFVEKESTKDLRHAANIMASSELNKEDLTANEIYDILVKSSEEELKQKLGFWAVPLPKKGDMDNKNTNKRYIRKK